MQDGLVLWLDARAQRHLMKMGQSKSVWKDLSGNGNDGQLMNFDFTEDSGWVDGGLKFDGADDYVDCGKINFGTENFTIEMIAKINDIPNQYGGTIIGNRGGLWEQAYTDGVGTELSFPQSRKRIDFRIADGENIKMHYATFDFTDNKQHHIIAQKTSTEMKIYIDGVLIGTVNHTVIGEINGYHNMKIGCRGNSGFLSDTNIYLTRIYNRALTDEEILQNYRATHFLLEPKTFTSTSYYNFYDLNRVEINTLATKDLAVVLRGDINLEDIVFDRDIKSIPYAHILNKIEKNIDKLGEILYRPKGWITPKLEWTYNQPFSYEDANRLEKNLLLLYNYAKGNIDKIPYCGMYTCGEEVI